jgi:hypothetical protein
MTTAHRQAKPFVRALLSATIFAAGALAAGVPANAVPAPEPASAVPAAAQAFKNLQTARCLTNPVGTGGMVNAYACAARSDQKWNVSSIGSYRVLRNVATGLCLDYSNTYDVRAIGCNNGNWQQWLPSRQSDGTILLINKATGGCLGDGKQTFVQACSSTRRDLRWY